MVSASKHVTAALALGLAMTALATPSFAQLREGGEAGMSSCTGWTNAYARRLTILAMGLREAPA